MRWYKNEPFTYPSLLEMPAVVAMGVQHLMVTFDRSVEMAQQREYLAALERRIIEQIMPDQQEV